MELWGISSCPQLADYFGGGLSFRSQAAPRRKSQSSFLTHEKNSPQSRTKTQFPTQGKKHQFIEKIFSILLKKNVREIQEVELLLMHELDMSRSRVSVTRSVELARLHILGRNLLRFEPHDEILRCKYNPPGYGEPVPVPGLPAGPPGFPILGRFA
ncbi:hypothetical protein KSP40_PGU005472 [Platanthera guangdongensis]|uniref:Ribosomal protein S4 n=1 Tax=Platanthera guangdongensis TaxID=2320717 RepID=A0ABR2LH69_9ASPA